MSDTNARFQIGGVILPIGASPGDVNVGEKALIVDSDGASMLVGAGGARVAVAPGPWTQIGPTVGDTDDVTISDLDGGADGGYEIRGYLAATAGTESFYLRPNGADANTYCGFTFLSLATDVVAGGHGSNLLLTDAGVGHAPLFRCTIDGDSTLKRQFRATGGRGLATGVEFSTTGALLVAAGNITSLVIHADSADGIKAGSVFFWRKLYL